MKRVLLIFPLLALLLSACGPEPEPTMSVDEIQGTAVAAAFTMIAKTQAAIPTATPIPPTETPIPTPTFTLTPLVSPTPLGGIPTATEAASEDECNRVLRSDPPGPSTTLKIVNETKSPATVSIFLYKTPFGECGFRSYNVTKNGSTKFTFPQGSYWITAILGAPLNKTIGNGPFTANNTDKWEIRVRENLVKFVGP